MCRFKKITTLPALALLFTIGIGAEIRAQETVSPAPEDSFASENAVLDTSILFAIGAREARQELRGAFGWPTFQEGLVEGVYFRFDPDGYARFAPSPRLDTDVFEVICRPRTLVCMGRKDTMQVTLNNRGQVQLELANITENDQFVLADGISELPLPPSIVQPLEPRLELLLSAGGELIVRRNNNEVHRISLAGFGAIVPYLRWVAAQQDYTVLPRSWPVPNASTGNDSPGLTQTTLWQSPMPQPHVVTQGQQPQSQAQLPMTAPNAAGDPQVGRDVAEVRGELNVLRELLLDRQPPQAEAPEAHSGSAPMAPATASPEQLEALISELMQMTTTLQQQVHQMQGAPAPRAAPNAMPQQPLGSLPQPQTPNTRDIARHLDYLMTEVGLAPDVALMVVQQAQQSQQAAVDLTRTEQDRVINDILSDLRAQLPNTGMAVPMPTLLNQQVTGSQYRLLSDYLRSTVQDQ